MAERAVPIESLLADYGHTTEPSRRLARTALEEARLTNPRKKNIAERKRDEVGEVLDRALLRICGSKRCEQISAGDRRPRALVEKQACSVCAGSDNAAAVERLVQTLRRAGRANLLVVGGSPNARAELTRLLDGSGVELRAVDGTVTVPLQRAEAWAAAADVIVIWGSTQLAHKVSQQFNGRQYAHKRFTVAQRGIAALADAVVEHVLGAGAAR